MLVRAATAAIIVVAGATACVRPAFAFGPEIMIRRPMSRDPILRAREHGGVFGNDNRAFAATTAATAASDYRTCHGATHTRRYASVAPSSSPGSKEGSDRYEKGRNKRKKRGKPRSQQSDSSPTQKNGQSRQQHKKKRRLKKGEINDLVRGLGLQPAVEAARKLTVLANSSSNDEGTAGSPKNGKKQEAKKISARVENEGAQRSKARASGSRTKGRDGKDKSSSTKTRKTTTIMDNRPDTELKLESERALDRTLPMPLQTQLDFARKGHAALRSFLPQSVVMDLRTHLIPYSENRTLEAWRQKVEVAASGLSSGSSSSSDGETGREASDLAKSCKTVEECAVKLRHLGVAPESLPFLQHFNSWRTLDVARAVATSSRLAHAAAKLLDVPSVKLYQDSIFHKRAGDGPTPWHSDARMAPFDTSYMITFWIPLQPVSTPENGGGTGLLFADRSHSDFALPYWNGLDGTEHDRLDERYAVNHHMPLDAGDVTVHAGWTLHCADGGGGGKGPRGGDRFAFAVTYVDARAELREDAATSRMKSSLRGGGGKGDDEDKWSYAGWVKDVLPRRVFRHDLVPIVWPKLFQPSDIATDEAARNSLRTLRDSGDERNRATALYALRSAGGRDGATLTMMGRKDANNAGAAAHKQRRPQINQDRSVLMYPFHLESPAPMVLVDDDSSSLGSASSSPGTPAAAKNNVLLGVFDGHSAFGEVVSEYAARNVPETVGTKLDELRYRAAAEVGDWTESGLANATRRAIVEAFVEVDRSGLAELHPPSGGTTASVVLQLGDRVYVANTGDSVSFVATYDERTGEAEVVYVTRRDRPDLPGERARIEAAGGQVRTSDCNPQDVPRVVYVDDETGQLCGGLALCRSIGDWEFGDIGVVPEPTVDVVDLNDVIGSRGPDGERVHAFAASLTDGLFDQVEVARIANIVASGLYDDSGPHLFTSLEDLLTEAKLGWHNAMSDKYRDDITIVASKLII